MANFVVDILTPSEVIGKELSARSLKVPTSRGEIEILPDHTHIIEKLDTGILEVVEDHKKSRYTITTGIVKVLGNKVTVLSNVSEAEDKIDKERAQMALEKATKALKNPAGMSEDLVVKFRRKLDRAKIRILLSS